MSLPLQATSKWKCLPEIHASRLSVSGSLRPKIGLVILSIVLIVSLCFILVPILTKLQINSSSRSYPVNPLPFTGLLTKIVSSSSTTNVIISPSIMLTTLSLLNTTPSSVTCSPPLYKFTNNIVNVSAQMLLRSSHEHSAKCLGKHITVIEKVTSNDQMIQHVRDRVRDRRIVNTSELEAADQAVILVTSDVRLRVPAHLRDSHLVVAGQFKVMVHKDFTMVRLDSLLDTGLELFLLQPHNTVAELTMGLTHNLLNMEEFGRSSVELVLPAQEMSSSLCLGPHLWATGHHQGSVPVYHQATLQFLPQVNNNRVTSDSEASNLVTRLVLDKKFLFILRHQDTVIQMGSIP